MAEITAAQVMDLRKKTDLPMMDCKAALIEAGGDAEAALEALRKKYKGKLDTKAYRETTEGLVTVYVSADKKLAGMVELRCETAQVAKTEQFQELARTLAQLVAQQAQQKPSPEVIMASTLPDDSSKNVKDLFGEVFGRLGENMVLARCRRVCGEYIAEYSHYTGKVASVVALSAAPSPESVGRDLCQHVAFSKPMAISRENIPSEKLESVKADAREEALEQGKPEKMVDKIAEGKLNAWCAQHCLMEQEHVKVNKTSVGKVLAGAGVESVTDMAFFELGVQ
jgi:elongation factor Ts